LALHINFDIAIRIPVVALANGCIIKDIGCLSINKEL